MLSKIDVVYCDGEAVEFRNQNNHRNGKAVCTLVRALDCTLIFRFCNTAGEPEIVVEPESNHQIQLLLSFQDHVLCSDCGAAVLAVDESGFQYLKVESLDIDTTEMRSCLNDSYLENDPERRGSLLCDLSVAVFTDNEQHSMQLFFTLTVEVKNQLAR